MARLGIDHIGQNLPVLLTALRTWPHGLMQLCIICGIFNQHGERTASSSVTAVMKARRALVAERKRFAFKSDRLIRDRAGLGYRPPPSINPRFHAVLIRSSTLSFNDQRPCLGVRDLPSDTRHRVRVHFASVFRVVEKIEAESATRG